MELTSIHNRHINKWLNKMPLSLSELRVGNLVMFKAIVSNVKVGSYSKEIIGEKLHIIIGIHLFGKLEICCYSDYKENDKEYDTILVAINELRPLVLPESTFSDIDFYLKDTGFIKTDSKAYEFEFDKEYIKLYQAIFDNYWTIEYSNKKNNIDVKLPIYQFHEFQNAFQIITQNKLKI